MQRLKRPFPPPVAPTHLKRIQPSIRDLILIQRQQREARLASASLGQRTRAAPLELVGAGIQPLQRAQPHQRLQQSKERQM